MKSDDEWITELEDPCLPKDNSWMDVHECFQVNEGCNGKRITHLMMDDFMPPHFRPTIYLMPY